MLTFTWQTVVYSPSSAYAYHFGRKNRKNYFISCATLHWSFNASRATAGTKTERSSGHLSFPILQHENRGLDRPFFSANFSFDSVFAGQELWCIHRIRPRQEEPNVRVCCALVQWPNCVSRNVWVNKCRMMSIDLEIVANGYWICEWTLDALNGYVDACNYLMVTNRCDLSTPQRDSLCSNNRTDKCVWTFHNLAQTYLDREKYILRFQIVDVQCSRIAYVQLAGVFVDVKQSGQIAARAGVRQNSVEFNFNFWISWNGAEVQANLCLPVIHLWNRIWISGPNDEWRIKCGCALIQRCTIQRTLAYRRRIVGIQQRYA